MSTVVHERPGVYSTYDVSSAIWRGNGGKVVGLAALASQGEANKVVRLSSYEEGVTTFGQDGEGVKMAALLRLIFLNGASEVRAVRVADADSYQDAFTALVLEEGIGIVVCDSDAEAVQLLMRESIKVAADARRERIGIAGSVGESVTEMVERAAEINHERMVLLGGDVRIRDNKRTNGKQIYYYNLFLSGGGEYFLYIIFRIQRIYQSFDFRIRFVI